MELSNLLSGEIFGFYVVMPQSIGGKAIQGMWTNENYVKPFYPDAKKGRVGGMALEHEGYTKLVEKAKAAMQSNEWKKIVTSRCFHWNIQLSQREQYVQQLRNRFPDSFLIVINHPDWGIWISASPELLLKKIGNNIETMALAGTLSVEGRADWGPKEIKEHEVVRDMIIETLISCGVKNIQTHPRTELYFNTVKHLQTRIHGDYDQSINHIVNALSPTPALAGMPVLPTMNWLLENEGYQRGLYGGVLNVQDGEDVYAIVLLRCLCLKDTGAIGFVGGGVMPNSDAEIEWNETLMKQNAFIFAIDENL